MSVSGLHQVALHLFQTFVYLHEGRHARALTRTQSWSGTFMEVGVRAVYLHRGGMAVNARPDRFATLILRPLPAPRRPPLADRAACSHHRGDDLKHSEAEGRYALALPETEALRR